MQRSPVIQFALTVVTALCLPLLAAAQTPQQVRMQRLNPAMPLPLRIDPERVAAAGIEVLSGKHICIYTDVRDQELTKDLIRVFDAAMAQWCNFFGVEPETTKDYQLSAMVIADRNNTQAFRKAGLIPADLPEFLAGYNRGHETWLYLQPGDYYTRHLLLHEGTHAFMQWFLRGSGPSWYSEGMAELLGLNRWQDGELELGYRVRSNLDCPYWGRVKILRNDVTERNELLLEQVMEIPAAAYRQVRAYAWSWAACDFLAHHPLTKDAFQQLTKNAKEIGPAFNRQFRQSIEDHWPIVQRDWQLYINEMVYGYEVDRGVLRAATQDAENSSVQVQADYSWQETPWRVQAGDRFQLTAEGQFELTVAKKTLPSAGGGITIEYYQGNPLGVLMMGVLDDQNPASMAKTSRVVGLGHDFVAERAGAICLRINTSPAKRSDNRGFLRVTFTKN
ncbi:MAG: hypothetical protein MK106_07430 [Mariniblastus sp.]|nr:hypothetical protein [Mariniblastus sp.]